MTQWRYSRLYVFGVDYTIDIKSGKDGAWYLESVDDANAIHDPAYFDGRKEWTGKEWYCVPLNPQRNWAETLRLRGSKSRGDYALAWDSDARHADLASEVMNRLGADGWELVGMDGHTYVFKKPASD